MKQGILVRALPVDILKGQAAELVVLTEHGKEVICLDMPHVIIKNVRDESSIDRIKLKIASYGNKVKQEEKPYARTGQKVLQISGNREYLAEICKEHSRHFDKISVPQWIRWQAKFPYSQVRFSDKSIEFGEMASLEDLLALSDAALDIETNKVVSKEEDLDEPNFDYKEVNTAVYVQEAPSDKYTVDVFTTLGAKRLHEVDDAIEKLIGKRESPLLDNLAGKRLHGFDNWEDIVTRLSTSMQISPIVMVSGHNLMSADLLWLRDFPDEEKFQPSIDENAPKITAHAGFGKRVEVKGFWVFDHYGLARFYLPFLPDKKAETVYNFFDIPFTKSMKHDSLGHKIWRAQNGSMESAVDVIYYAMLDAIASYKFGKKEKKVALQLSRAFETSLESVCSVAPKTLGKNFWDKRTYDQTNSFNFLKPTTYFRNFKVLEEKLKLLQLPETVQKGLIADKEIYAVYSYILPEVFTILNDDKYALEIIQAAKSAKGGDKFMLLRGLDALCEVPLHDLYKAHVSDDSKRVFYAKYKMPQSHAWAKLNDIAGEVKSFLNGVTVLNYTDDLLLVSGKDIEQKIANSKYLMHIGKIQSLYNHDVGVYAATMDDKLIAQGIDLGGKGLTTEKEKTFPRVFFETLLRGGGRAAALNKAFNELAQPLAQGNLPKRDLLIRVRPSKKPEEYSKKYQGSFPVYCSQKFNLEPGKTYYVGFGLGSSLVPEEYLEKDFSKPEICIDSPRYQKWIFEEGRMGEILKTVYNPLNEKGRATALKHFFLGRASQVELDLLARPVDYVKPEVSSKQQFFSF